jgi:SAM-dependent methyltransferase
MTLKVDQAWRRRLLADLAPRAGEAMLDLCAGTMDVAALALRRTPGLRIVGADFSFQMLARGVEKTGLPASQADAMALPFHAARFDLATVTFGMRNLERYEVGLAELARVLKPGGRLGVLEFFRPESTGSRFVHGAYNRLALPVWAILARSGGVPLPGRLHGAVRLAPAVRGRGAAGRLPRRARRDALPRRVRARHGGARVKLVVAVSGASGAPYARRLLDFLAANGEKHGLSVDLVFTQTGKQVGGGDRVRAPLPVPRLEEPGLHRAVRVRLGALRRMVVIPAPPARSPGSRTASRSISSAARPT